MIILLKNIYIYIYKEKKKRKSKREEPVLHLSTGTIKIRINWKPVSQYSDILT